jgi:hypothetical protein
MIVVAVEQYLLFKEMENPFLKLKTQSGIVLAPGFADSRETGNIEELDQIIGFGIVEVTGPKCEVVKVGDGIFYDRRSIRAVPLQETLWQYNERNIIAIVPNDDEVIQEAFKDYYKEQAEISAKQREHLKKLQDEKDKKAEERLAKIASGEIKDTSATRGPLIKIKYDNNQ